MGAHGNQHARTSSLHLRTLLPASCDSTVSVTKQCERLL
jgi:hypothetical protein